MSFKSSTKKSTIYGTFVPPDGPSTAIVDAQDPLHTRKTGTFYTAELKYTYDHEAGEVRLRVDWLQVPEYWFEVRLSHWKSDGKVTGGRVVPDGRRHQWFVDVSYPTKRLLVQSANDFHFQCDLSPEAMVVLAGKRTC